MKTINYDVMVDTIDESFENDDPSLIEEILDNKIEYDELTVKDHLEFCIEDSILEAIENKKPNTFRFLTDNFPSVSLSYELPIACVETHTVFSFKRGAVEVEDITKLYKVEDGQLVIDEEKFQEVASDCWEFEPVDDCWISEIKGGYPREFYSKDNPELQRMLERYDIDMKFE